METKNTLIFRRQTQQRIKLHYIFFTPHLNFLHEGHIGRNFIRLSL
jgi:hypothetical protein